MKRVLIALIIALVLIMALGSIAYAHNPSDKAYDAPAKGHYGVPGKGVGHQQALGAGHEIHGEQPDEPPPPGDGL